MRAVFLCAAQRNEHHILPVLLQPLLDLGERHRQEVVLTHRPGIASRVVFHLCHPFRLLASVFAPSATAERNACGVRLNEVLWTTPSLRSFLLLDACLEAGQKIV